MFLNKKNSILLTLNLFNNRINIKYFFMRIAIIADPLDNQNAGVHIYTKAVLDEFAKRNDGHEYILIRQQESDDYPNFEQIVLKNINLPIGYASIRLFFLIPYVLRKKKVDVVIEPAHFGPFNLPKRIKRVTVIHDLTPIKFPEYHRWHSQLLQKLFLGRILKNTDWVITNSQNTTNDLEEYYPVTKGKNSPFLLGKAKRFRPTTNSERIKELGISEPFFLSVGTIEPRKNLIVLLDAYEIFCKQTKHEIQLIIAGGMGWKSESFEEKLNQHPFRNQIKVLGYVENDDLPILYSHCKVLIYPSIYEGFGFPILEGMACGAPVICSNNSSLPEVGGDVAFYFPADSSDKLFELMLKFASCNEEELDHISKRGLERAKLFSWKNHAEQIIEVLEKLVS